MTIEIPCVPVQICTARATRCAIDDWLLGQRILKMALVEMARRDTLEKCLSIEGIVEDIAQNLVCNSDRLIQKSLDFRAHHITEVDTFEDFKKTLEEKTGFISAHWDGTVETEAKIKALTKATIRCIPLDKLKNGYVCFSGNAIRQRVLFAKAY